MFLLRHWKSIGGFWHPQEHLCAPLEQLVLSEIRGWAAWDSAPSPLLPSPFWGAAPGSHPILQSFPSKPFLVGCDLNCSLAQKINEIRPCGWKSPAPSWGVGGSLPLGTDGDAWRYSWMPREAVGDALWGVSGVMRGALAVLTPHPSG